MTRFPENLIGWKTKYAYMHQNFEDDKIPMGGGDHCAVWGCDNDRRYPEK